MSHCLSPLLRGTAAQVIKDTVRPGNAETNSWVSKASDSWGQIEWGETCTEIIKGVIDQTKKTNNLHMAHFCPVLSHLGCGHLRSLTMCLVQLAGSGSDATPAHAFGAPSHICLLTLPLIKTKWNEDMFLSWTCHIWRVQVPHTATSYQILAQWRALRSLETILDNFLQESVPLYQAVWLWAILSMSAFPKHII